MRKGRNRCLGTMVAALIVVTATSCTAPGGSAALLIPSAPGSPPPPVLASGLVAKVTGPDGLSLEVFDARSGRRLRTIALPDDARSAPMLSRAQFSLDWSWLVWIRRDDSLAIAKLRGDAYVQTAVVDARQLGARPGVYVKRAQFLPATGQLVVVFTGDSYRQPPAAVVDPRHPLSGIGHMSTDLGEVDGYGDRTELSVVPVRDEPALRAHINASKRELVEATVVDTGTTTHNGRVYAIAYGCDGPALDTTHIACAGIARTGAVVILARDGDAATLRQLVAPGGPAVTAIVPSPDRDRLLVERKDGWFVVPVDGSADPASAFQAFQVGPDDKVSVLAWIP